MIETAILFFFAGVAASLIGANIYLQKQIDKVVKNVKLNDGTKLSCRNSFVYPGETWISICDDNDNCKGHMYVKNGCVTRIQCH